MAVTAGLWVGTPGVALYPFSAGAEGATSSLRQFHAVKEKHGQA